MRWKNCSGKRKSSRGAGVFDVMQQEDIWVIATTVACFAALAAMVFVTLL
jgi:hypothetical protein